MVWATHKIPDWKFWRDMPQVDLWQACALSLNLDPDSLTFSNDGMGGASYIKMQSFPNEEAWEKFNKRLRLLEAKMRESRVVPLADFVKWALSLSTPWDMPPELENVASVVKPSKVETPLPTANANPEHNGLDWKQSARLIADEFFDRDTNLGTRSTLDNYSARVMDEMQKRNIHGPRGRIDNANTIKRDALQGSKWWGKKKK